MWDAPISKTLKSGTTGAQLPGLNYLEMGPAKRHELVKIIVITIAPRV